MKYFLLFCFLWWILFFIFLPIGIIKRQSGIKKLTGMSVKAHLLLKITATTLISLLFVLVLFYFVHKGYIDPDFYLKIPRLPLFFDK
jgi:predicted secreted protein